MVEICLIPFQTIFFHNFGQIAPAMTQRKSSPNPIQNDSADRILIVDDDKMQRLLLVRLLNKNYTLREAETGEACIDAIPDFQPDLILMDIDMPGMSGYETCQRIKNCVSTSTPQIILVSAKISREERLRGYEVGADDYVTKPYDPDELLAKVAVHLRLRRALTETTLAHAAIERHSRELEDIVKEQTSALRQYADELETLIREQTEEIIMTRDLTLFAMAKLTDSRDPETGLHLERIRFYCDILADELSHNGPYIEQINPQFRDDLYRSSPMHDIGKIGIPDAILLKPGRLSDREFDLMKQHTIIGAEALGKVQEHTRSGRAFSMAIEIARSHHERFDGSGYPDGLIGLDIPLSARIVALADVYDALTSSRVYKDAFSHDVAKTMIEQESEGHFDPVISQSFLRRVDDFRKVSKMRELPTEETFLDAIPAIRVA